jgi:energy-coupling factor transporter transmembrane protein EcfT
MKESTFLYYLPKDSLYFKISFLNKLLIIIIVSIFVLLIKNALTNFIITLFVLSLIILTNFHKHNINIFKFLGFAVFIFSLFWLLLSKIPGEIIYFSTPWNTFVSETTINFMLLAISKWISIVLLGILFMVTTNENQLINNLISKKTNINVILFFTTLFNTLGFSIKEIKDIEFSLYSRGFKKRGFLGKIKKIKYIGAVQIVSNLKRIETLNQSYILRKKEIIRGLKYNAGNKHTKFKT